MTYSLKASNTRLVLISIFLAGAMPLQAAIEITPASPLVRQGQTISFTANAPVSWSLAPGSVGSIDADGTYHAPAHVAVQQQAGGCQLLPNGHIYNTRIDA